jgi:hypothetical protein
MNQWALPTIAVMRIAYGALSSRLRTTPVSQAMVFVALGLLADRRLRGREPDPGPDGARALAMVAQACAGPRWGSWAGLDPADWP